MSGCNEIVTQGERGRGTNRMRIISQIEYSEVNNTKNAEHLKLNLEGVVHTKMKNLPLSSHPVIPKSVFCYFPLGHKK